MYYKRSVDTYLNTFLKISWKKLAVLVSKTSSVLVSDVAGFIIKPSFNNIMKITTFKA